MIFNFVLALFFGWLMVLSFIIFKMKSHYSTLTTRTKKQKIDEILDSIIKDNEKAKDSLEKIQLSLEKIDNEAKLHYQKLGLVRFNPFGRTTGEQSFVLALLNNYKDGLVINFIYTPEGIRVYTKPVKKGKGEKYDLSEEEKQAIMVAK